MILPRPRYVILCLLAVLCLPLAFAPSAVADAEMPVLPVSLDDIELLPIREIEWAVLMQEHPELVKRMMFLGKQLERVHEHLQSRENPQDSGGRMLQQEVVRIVSALKPHLEELLEIVRPMGIDDEALALLHETPKGPMRLRRHAMRLVLHVPDRTEAQEVLHARLVPAADAALLTWHAALQGLEDIAELDASTRDALAARIEAETRAVEKRFWRVVDSTLDQAQRVTLRRRLPTKVAKHADLFGHLYTLPGLEVTQATRLKALFVRLEAEAAPDQAQVDRATAQLAEPGHSSEERRRIAREKEAAERRNLGRFVSAWKEGVDILTREQAVELDSILPLLTAQDRPGDLEVLVKEIPMKEGQHSMLADLHRRYGHVEGQLRRDVATVEGMEKRFGPDSPQRAEVDVMRAQAFGKALREARHAARELFLVVLTPDQVTHWVLGVR